MWVLSLFLINEYAFWFPVAMSILWTIGAVWFYCRVEFCSRAYTDPPLLDDAPPVSIIIPCYNEEDLVTETIEYAVRSEYPNLEVIAVNDGSRDNTGDLLDLLALQHSRLKVIHQENLGKAAALVNAAQSTDNEILICIDGDSIVDRHAVSWIARVFVQNPGVGAVTGNPRIRNRSAFCCFGCCCCPVIAFVPHHTSSSNVVVSSAVADVATDGKLPNKSSLFDAEEGAPLR